MAVQIPQIKRFAPQEPTSMGRIDTPVVDGSKAVAAVGEGLTKLSASAVDLYNKAQDDAIKLAATSADNEYEAELKALNGKLNALDGDPATIYANYDDQEKAIRDKVLKKYETADNRTKKHIEKTVETTRLRLTSAKEINYAVQHSKYDKKTTDNALKLRQDSIYSTLAQADVNKPETFNDFKAVLKDMDRLVVEWADRNGFITKDDKGNQKLSEQAYMMIAEARSTAIRNAITSLNIASNVDASEYLLKEYRDQLSTKDYESLFKSTKDDRELILARKFNAGLGGLKPVEAMERINSITDEGVKEKAQKLYDDAYRRNTNTRERQARESYSDLYDAVKNGEFTSYTQIETTPAGREMLRHLSVEQKRGIEREFKNGAIETDPDSYNILMDHLRDGTLGDIPRGDWLLMRSRLNKNDAKFFETRYRAANETTTGESNKSFSHIINKVDKIMIEQGIVKQKYGKRMSEKDKKLVGEYRREIVEYFAQNPVPNGNLFETDRQLRAAIAKKKAGELFIQKRPERPPAPQGTPAPRGTAAPRPALSADQKKKWIGRWNEKYPKDPFDSAKHQLWELIDKEGDGKP